MLVIPLCMREKSGYYCNSGPRRSGGLLNQSGAMSKNTIVGLVACALTALSGAAVADLNTAQNYYEQGRTSDALNEIDGILQANAADPEARFLKGIIFAEQGRNDAAIEIFAGLTQDYPELPEPYNNLAVLFAEKGEFEKAREALLSAIQTHPSYSTAHENLGDLYAKMAGMAYDRALEEDRANESARMKLTTVNGLFSVPHSPEPVQVAAAPTQARAPAPDPEPVADPEPVLEPPVVAAADPAPRREIEAAITPEPQPAPEPAPTARSRASDSGAVVAAVEGWRVAWSGQDVDGYINAYADDYAPDGATHAAWTRQRRQRLTAPNAINVGVDDMEIEFPGEDLARVTFVQSYQSDSYNDRVRKTLTLTRTGNGWRIVGEESEPL